MRVGYVIWIPFIGRNDFLRMQFVLQEVKLYAECRAKLKNFKFIFVPLFSKQILTKQNMASSKNRQQFLASQISVLMRNKAIKSSSPNHPFFQRMQWRVTLPIM